MAKSFSLRRSVLRRGSVATAIVVVATVVPAAPAAAATTLSCNLVGRTTCSTGFVDATSRVTLGVLNGSSIPITCYAIPPGGPAVVHLTGNSAQVKRTKAFDVPYNSYQLYCVRTDIDNGGHGTIWNF